MRKPLHLPPVNVAPPVSSITFWPGASVVAVSVSPAVNVPPHALPTKEAVNWESLSDMTNMMLLPTVNGCPQSSNDGWPRAAQKQKEQHRRKLHENCRKKSGNFKAPNARPRGRSHYTMAVKTDRLPAHRPRTRRILRARPRPSRRRAHRRMFTIAAVLLGAAQPWSVLPLAATQPANPLWPSQASVARRSSPSLDMSGGAGSAGTACAFTSAHRGCAV